MSANAVNIRSRRVNVFAEPTDKIKKESTKHLNSRNTQTINEHTSDWSPSDSINTISGRSVNRDAFLSSEKWKSRFLKQDLPSHPFNVKADKHKEKNERSVGALRELPLTPKIVMAKVTAASKSRGLVATELSDVDEGYESPADAPNMSTGTRISHYEQHMACAEAHRNEVANIHMEPNDCAELENDESDSDVEVIYDGNRETDFEIIGNEDSSDDQLDDDVEMNQEIPEVDIMKGPTKHSYPQKQNGLTPDPHMSSKKRSQATLSDKEEDVESMKRRISKERSQRALDKGVAAVVEARKVALAKEAQLTSKSRAGAVSRYKRQGVTRLRTEEHPLEKRGGLLGAYNDVSSREPIDQNSAPLPQQAVKGSPEERGCEVTDENKQSGPLLGTYFTCPELNHIEPSFELQYADLGVLFDPALFPSGLNLDILRSFVSTTRIPAAFLGNPARDTPIDYFLKPVGQSQILAFKKGGDNVDALVFGFVTKSDVLQGRTYKGAGVTRLLKSMEVNLLSQEGERLLAMLSMVGGGKPMDLLSLEGGVVSFATKHTPIDDDGVEIKSECDIFLINQFPDYPFIVQGVVQED
ncbi:unnamed protein product [Peniophora sp. CBMAI 1063]|nr:unnamed protein product [Peniophora sp. CBMAI 1063]